MGLSKLRKPLILILILSVLLMGCRFIVNFFAFHPDRHDLLPADRLPAGLQEVFIPTKDREQLQCYWIARQQSPWLLIYFHGNAGNIGHRIPDLLTLADMGLNVLGVGYRGYGKSTGSPSEQGIYRDGQAALAYAQKILGFNLKRIILLGRSLGSCVAVDIARQKALAALVLVTPMTTGRAMGKFHRFGPIALMAGNAFDNLTKIKAIQCPLLIVHGRSDEIVPFYMGEQLYAQAPQPKRFVPIQGAGHNDISIVGADRYWGAIRQLIETLSNP